MRARAAVIAVTAACALAGCASSPTDQVKAKVQQFATAAANRDYATICSQVLAPSLVAHLEATGLGCPGALRAALGNVRHPTLSIGPITVRGKTASVYTLSLAEGQVASLEILELIDTRKGWRISSLHSPLPA